MFERAHHQRVARVLEALDSDLLVSNGCLFGGGTAIALRHREYRESVGIDFIVSHLAGYRGLRERLAGPKGFGAIARPQTQIQQLREVRADQYGLRTMLRVDDTDIKFELILEGRIVLAAPGPDDSVCGVATLTPLDMAATKLLANADRWRDDSVLSRDLIDLAMMQPTKALLRQAIEKAEAAYGESVAASLDKAIADLRLRPHRLDQCMAAMRMTTVPKALLWKRIKRLVP